MKITSFYILASLLCLSGVQSCRDENLSSEHPTYSLIQAEAIYLRDSIHSTSTSTDPPKDRDNWKIKPHIR